MNFKAVIFDMDGTLLNSLEDLADSMNQVLQERGLPVYPVADYRNFVGSGAIQLVARVLPKDQESLIKDCLDDFLAAYARNWKVKTRLYPGVADLLDALTARKTPLSVLTNKPQDFAELCMREFFAHWPFFLTVGQRPNVPVKPDPAGPRQIIKALGCDPAEVLYVGDTNVDMGTAVNAGMFPLGVLWGFRDEEELRQAGALAIARQPSDILRFFLRSRLMR